MAKSSALIQQYARMGAQTRLAELRAEIAQIERAFPDLGPRRGPRRRPAAAPSATANTDNGQTVNPDQPVARKRKRRGMSAAQRKAVGERMRRYWAARRKAEAKKT